jgi:capsular exopolysaccharide synthesis family protein
MLGMGLALLRYKMDSRIYKPDQVEQMGFETTIVPDIKGLVGSGNDGTALVERNGKQLPASLVTVHDASSHATEAYRQLRTNIQFGLNEEGSNVVVVTSPGVGEGKSTTAANLAVAFAQAGYRTLLMDGDMRRPQVHRLMGRSLEPGLFQLLQGDLSISPSRLETHIGNLFAIPAGRLAGGSAAEVTGGRNMRTLVSSLRDHFDIIIIDTPPTLAVAEARQLAPKADATLMVVRAGSTRENELGFAIEQLERVGARVMGVVLNGFDMSMAYGYEYRYQQYVHYGTEDADVEDADVAEAGTAQPDTT